MRCIKATCGAIAALVMLAAGSASAADLPMEAPPVVAVPGFSWTGAYVGGAIGYAFSDLKARNRNALGGDLFSVTEDVDSVTGSAFVGYNHQFDSIVVGAEADISIGDFGGKTRGACPAAGAFTFSCKANADDLFGTIRGRVGFAFDRFLVFGTGGLAIGSEVDFRRTSPFGAPFDFTKKESGTRYGYTLGAGVDHAVTDNIIVRGEYQYVDFGTEKLNLSNTIGGTQSVRIEQDLHLLRAGVAYKF